MVFDPHQQKRIRLSTVTSYKCPSGMFANHLNRLGEGLERLELCVILSAAPLCEVPMRTTKNRPRYDRDKLRYPSDLTDEEWSLVEPADPAGQARRPQNARWWCGRW